MFFRKRTEQRREEKEKESAYKTHNEFYPGYQNTSLEDDEDYEGQTSLLTEQPGTEDEESSESETTLLDENYGQRESSKTVRGAAAFDESEDDEEEYEGQTSLLSEDLSPYFNPNSPYSDGANRTAAPEDKAPENKASGDKVPEYETLEDDDEGGTTVLSQDEINAATGLYIPQNAPKAYILRIIHSEKISINKIKFLIGSAQNADYVIHENSVSRNHAYIIYNSGKYFLVDNKSTNKTSLDGNILEPLKPVELYHGALIQFAEELYQFVEEK